MLKFWGNAANELRLRAETIRCGVELDDIDGVKTPLSFTLDSCHDSIVEENGFIIVNHSSSCLHQS